MEEKEFLEEAEEVKKILEEQEKLQIQSALIEEKFKELGEKLAKRKEAFLKCLKDEIEGINNISDFLKKFNEYYNKEYLAECDYLELLITFLKKFKHMCYTEKLRAFESLGVSPKKLKWKRLLLINESERTLKKKFSIYTVNKKSTEIRFSNDGRAIEWIIINDKIFLSNDKEETKLFMEMQNNF